MKTFSDRRVRVLEANETDARRGEHCCVLGREIVFNTQALERASWSELERVDSDLMVLLAAVAHADRAIRRVLSTGWGRSIALAIPVHEVELWRDVAEPLALLLRDLTGDQWQFTFRRRKHEDVLLQRFLRGLPNDLAGGTIVPYSGGLDSFAAVQAHRLRHPTERILLVHARHPGFDLGSTLSPGGERLPTLPVPFDVSAGVHAEPSFRTRTFLFYGLAALACRRTKGQRVLVAESGPGCLGPTLVPYGIEHPNRNSHPTFVSALRLFLSRLWGRCAEFELPNLWRTKGDMLAALVDGNAVRGWEHTRSCSRSARRQHPGECGAGVDHCGLCTQCVYRRLSLAAAALSESRARYLFDLGSLTALPSYASPADREVLTYAVQSLDALARMPAHTEAIGAHATEIALALRQPIADVTTSLHALLRRHAEQWDQFLSTLPFNSPAHDLLMRDREDPAR